VSALSDIMAGLRTIVELIGKAERLEQNVDKLAGHVDAIDRRLIRVETIIEVTRTDGATLRIAKNPE